MFQDRLFLLLQCLHLVKGTQQKKVGNDLLFKVRQLIDHLSAVFPVYFHIGREHSVDEMMIGTGCGISFLQYIRKKPTKSNEQSKKSQKITK